jgi:hypothetical protein
MATAGHRDLIMHDDGGREIRDSRYGDFWSRYVMLGLDPSIGISIHDRKMARRQPIRTESDPRVEPEDDDGVLEGDDGVLEDDDGACRSAIMRTAGGR